MTSFNPNTKMTLMMVFKKSQPTTFQCSKCVIQCNNPAQMPDQDLTRLIKFLGKAPDHPLPIAEVEAPTTVTTVPSTDKTSRIGTENKRKGIPVTAPTPPADTQTSMTSLSSESSEDVHPQNRTSGTSQIGACSSNLAQIPQASSQVDSLKNPAPERFVTPDNVIDTTYPIALIGFPSSNKTEKLKDDLQRQLPGKTIMHIKDTNDLKTTCHLFETILVDLGTSGTAPYSSHEFEDALNTYRKKMLVQENLAVFVLVPAHKHATDTVGQLAEAYKVPVFKYGSESGGQSLFDDDTKERLVSWLRDSYEKHHAAASQMGNSFLKKIKNFVGRPLYQ